MNRLWVWGSVAFFICLAAGFAANPARGQVTATAEDTPLAIPDGDTVLSTLEFPVDGVVEDLEVWVAVTFEQPQGSGLFIDLLGPNQVAPPGSGLFLASPGGGDLYMRITSDAAATCNELCGTAGCGAPEAYVTCRAFDDLSPFFGESAQDTWQLRVGNGPPNGGVLESWSLTLSGTGALAAPIFQDGFESGDTSAWSTAVTPTTARFSFEYDPAGTGNLSTVGFINESLGPVLALEWNFGDGASSTAENPVRTFALPGTYSVSLTVFDSTSSDTVTQNVVVPGPGS
ncbi:MAG: PKD domain-containing protein [Acidobacteriota bacterium]